MQNYDPKLLPASFVPFTASSAFKEKQRVLIPEKAKSQTVVFLSSIKALFDTLKITDGMTLSFHHHLRNGDYVFNMVMEEIKKRNLKNMHLAPSAIFPNNQVLSELIENGNVTDITTNYLNGPVAETIGKGLMKGMLIMDTHGGRARAIESGDLKIDVAILSAPAVDLKGNGNGIEGPSACGSLGYAISDLKYAKKVVLVTDSIIDSLKRVDLPCEYVDYVVKLDKIGDPKESSPVRPRLRKIRSVSKSPEIPLNSSTNLTSSKTVCRCRREPAEPVWLLPSMSKKNAG